MSGSSRSATASRLAPARPRTRAATPEADALMAMVRSLSAKPLSRPGNGISASQTARSTRVARARSSALSGAKRAVPSTASSPPPCRAAMKLTRAGAAGSGVSTLHRSR